MADKKLAISSAWTEYDMFCENEGRCSFGKHKESVEEIIDYYKTFVPEFRDITFNTEDELDKFVCLYFS